MHSPGPASSPSCSRPRSRALSTSLPVEVVQAGDEPDLPPVARGLLFGIVHNAMTNVLRHAQASRVETPSIFRPATCVCPCRTTASGYPKSAKSGATVSATWPPTRSAWAGVWRCRRELAESAPE